MGTFLVDVQELKPGLILFRRSDVTHHNWYCRIKVPGEDRYKTLSLKTSNVNEARDKAYDHEVDVRFRVKHGVPIFDKPFREVAKEYKAHIRLRVDSGELTLSKWKMKVSLIDRYLVAYMGNDQITNIGDAHWTNYPLWRMEKAKEALQAAEEAALAPPENNRRLKKPRRVIIPKHDTIRMERIEFRTIMAFAADRNYIRATQIPKGKLMRNTNRREGFSPQEYRALHTFARKWIKEASNDKEKWHRSMIYYFVLVMANTGMRPSEAKNLNWRNIDIRKDKQGREFVVMSVHGKDKFRELVATMAVADYLDRIRKISRATKPDDPVFSTPTGKRSADIYKYQISDLFTAAGLRTGPDGTTRVAYSLRHTYATFRLMEGVSELWLSEQMGTSVQMIKSHYGHIKASKNAELILQGMPGWDHVESNKPASSGTSPWAEGSKTKKSRTRP